jgi:hypothetical protein
MSSGIFHVQLKSGMTVLQIQLVEAGDGIGLAMTPADRTFSRIARVKTMEALMANGRT